MSLPKLYYTTTSCGMANYIAATIGGINWAGAVPALVLPGGAVLNENVATLTWISDNAVTKWGPADAQTYFELINNGIQAMDYVRRHQQEIQSFFILTYFACTPILILFSVIEFSHFFMNVHSRNI